MVEANARKHHMNHLTTCITASLITATCCVTTPSHADLTAAIDWQFSYHSDHLSSPNVFGWKFTATNDINVEQLGMHTFSSTGLQGDHTVGLFDEDGDMLASTELTQGWSGDLNTEYFVYNDIDTVALQQGKSYYLLADNLLDDGFTLLNENSSFGAEIQWETVVATGTTSIYDPIFSDSPDYDWFNQQGQAVGATFQYSLAPAPGALALLGLAGCARRRRRR